MDTLIMPYRALWITSFFFLLLDTNTNEWKTQTHTHITYRNKINTYNSPNMKKYIECYKYMLFTS